MVSIHWLRLCVRLRHRPRWRHLRLSAAITAKLFCRARLLNATGKVLIPHIPAATLRASGLTQVAKPETPVLINNNKAFHQLLLEGVKVAVTTRTVAKNQNRLRAVGGFC